MGLTKKGTFIYYNEKKTFWNRNKRNVWKEWTVNCIHEQTCGWSLFWYDAHGNRYITEFESDILFWNKISPESLEENGQIIIVQIPAAALIFLFCIILLHTVAQVVKILRCKMDGRWFDSRRCHWLNTSRCTLALGLTQSLTEMSTGIFPGG